MAPNGSDDESCRAPESFHVSSASHDDCCDEESLTAYNAGASIVCKMKIKCQLCGKEQCRFYCRACVKNGNIVHSAHQQKVHMESLAEKQQRFLGIQGSFATFRERFNQLITQRKACEDIQFEIKRKKNEQALLNQLNAEKRAKLKSLTEQRDHLHKINIEKFKHLPKYPIKVKELENSVLDLYEKTLKLKDVQNSLVNKLQKTIRQNILQLVEYIFPISEVVLKDERREINELAANNPGDSETITALADAKNTSFIRGKWIIHGSGISEMQYRIVAPSLPANGDYSAYTDWLSDNKDDVPRTTANEITPSRVTAFRIVGALTYTTQLTQLLSYYLNARLPFKLIYSEFSKKLYEEQFLRKVSRLNSNIMYLAYTQQVQLRTLNENHTLENISAILDLSKSDLGCHGFHEVGNAQLQKSVDSVLIGIETATESESEDENSLRLDWESLPNLPTHPDLVGSNSMPLTQRSTISQGLMTSAAHRLTSMFRWNN